MKNDKGLNFPRKKKSRSFREKYEDFFAVRERYSGAIMLKNINFLMIGKNSLSFILFSCNKGWKGWKDPRLFESAYRTKISQII